MKLFKRTAKDADGVTPSAQLTSAPAEPKAAKNSLNTLLPGVLAAVVGIILAGALLWFGPLLLVLAIALAFYVKYWRKTEAGLIASDALLLRVPLAGTFVVRVSVLNFCQTLAVLLENGITTAEALRLAEKTAPNRAAAVKFMEYLSSDKAQAYFADGNNEWPVVKGSVKANPTLAAMGNFKPDALPIGDLAKTTVAAQKVFDRAGWK